MKTLKRVAPKTAKFGKPKIRVNSSRFLIWLVVFTLPITLACSEKNRAGDTTPKLPSQIIQGFKLVESSQGTKTYSLVADSAYLYDDEKRIEVFNPTIDFYDDSGTLFSNLKAKLGTVYTNNSNLTARSDVIVTTRDSTVLYTDSLSWLNSQGTVTTDAWVKIHSPEGDILGRGLVSDAQLKKIEIREKITGTSPYKFGP